MKIRFWGVRGSIPTPGAQTVRYGGNSSCVELTSDGGVPLMLDAGTGARGFGRELLGRQIDRVGVVFTHFHMDHLFGFPFFAPVYAPSCTVDIVVPAYAEDEARGRLSRYLNGVYHPVRVGDLPAKVSFSGCRVGRAHELGPFRLTPVRLNHPGGSCGYRIECDGQSVCYLTDTAPLARMGEGLAAGKAPPAAERAVLDAIVGADLVIMDTMFSLDEYLEKMTWGHSYPEYGVQLCEGAGVRHLVLFHHAPDAPDDRLDAQAAHWAAHPGMKVSLAIEGQTIELGRPA